MGINNNNNNENIASVLFWYITVYSHWLHELGFVLIFTFFSKFLNSSGLYLLRVNNNTNISKMHIFAITSECEALAVSRWQHWYGIDQRCSWDVKVRDKTEAFDFFKCSSTETRQTFEKSWEVETKMSATATTSTVLSIDVLMTFPYHTILQSLLLNRKSYCLQTTFNSNCLNFLRDVLSQHQDIELSTPRCWTLNTKNETFETTTTYLL